MPDGLEVYARFTVTLDDRNRLEPDVLVARAGADPGPKETRLLPADVILVAEVVSEDSVDRDREAKPLKYARAGISHLWRIEPRGDGLAVAYVYELDPATRSYAPTGIFHNRIKLTVPFPVDLDLTAIDRRR